jgi:hypothetical protein
VKLNIGSYLVDVIAPNSILTHRKIDSESFKKRFTSLNAHSSYVKE